MLSLTPKERLLFLDERITEILAIRGLNTKRLAVRGSII
jgi:hypothetical protein